MKTILAVLALALLPGCAYMESKQYLHALATDPDCDYNGKPREYSLPPKCGVKSYGGRHVTVIRTSPNTYYISK
jgi:hypothetical protein